MIDADGKIELDSYDNVFVMKCLREVDDEDIVKKACGKTDLNLVTRIEHFSLSNSLLPSEWEATIYVCKHLRNLVHVELTGKFSEDILRKIVKLLKERCFRTLKFVNVKCSDMTHYQLVSALTNSKCTVNHEHAELSHLELTSNITDADVPAICAFLKNAHGNHLQELILRDNKLTCSGISKLCKVLADIPCRDLTYLELRDNAIGDEGVRVLH